MPRSPIGVLAVIVFGTASSVGLVSACGLDSLAASDPVDASSLPDAPVADPPLDAESQSEPDTGTDAPVAMRCMATTTACTAALADGWTPVALPVVPNGSCPSNHDSKDLLKGSAADDACTCLPLASPQDPASCDRDDAYGGSTSVVIPTCLDTSARFKVDGETCTPVSGSGWIAGKFSPIVHLGACTPSCTADPSKLTKTTVRVCEPSPSCVEDVCIGASAGTTAGGLHFCIAHDGDVACPDDAGYVNRQVVATEATVACEGATCTNDVKCTDAKLRLYGDSACSGNELGVLNADGKCNGIGTGTRAIRYSATRMDLPSKIVLPAKPTVSLAGARTICCRTPT